MMLRNMTAFLLFASSLHPQHVLYNQKLDQTAQAAVTAAKQITSGSVFDTMVRNLDIQARQETDTVLAYTREIMRATLVSVKLWGHPDDVPDTTIAGVVICNSLRCELDKLEKTIKRGSLLDSQIDATTAAARIKIIEGKSRDLETALRKLRAAAKTEDPAVVELLSHLGDAKDLTGYAQKIGALTGNAGLGKSLDEIASGLDQTIALYDSVKSIWEGYQAVKVEPSSLRPAREAIEVQLLRLEEQHIENLARIRASGHLEAGDVLDRIGTARIFLRDQLKTSARIEETLRAAAAAPSSDREQLRNMLLGLLEAAAAIAANDAAPRLELTREGQEERRHSIRRSAVNSSTYDQMIQAAVQRLATYYKGGVKPSDLAALIFFLSNSVAIPAIAIH